MQTSFSWFETSCRSWAEYYGFRWKL